MHFSHFSNYNYIERGLKKKKEKKQPSHLWHLFSFPGGSTGEDDDLSEVLLVPLGGRVDGGFRGALKAHLLMGAIH